MIKLLALLFLSFVYVNAYNYKVAVMTRVLDEGQDLIEYMPFRMGLNEVLNRSVDLTQFWDPADTIEMEILDEQGRESTAFNIAIEISDICAENSSVSKAVDIIIGTLYSRTAIVAQQIVQRYNIPMLSWSATSPQLSDKAKFPTFSRTVAPDNQQAKGLAITIKQFGWSTVGLMYANDVYSSGIATAFSIEAGNYGIDIPIVQGFAAEIARNRAFIEPVVRNILKQLKDNNIYIILFVAINVDVEEVLPIIAEYGMDTLPYQWIGVEGNLGVLPIGAIMSSPFFNISTPENYAFNQRYSDYAAANNISFARYNQKSGLEHVTYFESSQYECFLFGMNAISRLSKIRHACEDSTALPSYAPDGSCALLATQNGQGLLLNKLIRNLEMIGLTGLVKLDNQTGDRIMPVVIRNQNIPPQRYADIPAIAYVDLESKFTQVREVIWSGGSSLVPLDKPGYRAGDTVPSNSSPSVGILSYGVSVVAAWTALIIVEQAVSAHLAGNKKATYAWLILVSVSLAISIWCSMIIGVTALSINLLSIVYDPTFAFVTLLLAVCGSYITFTFAIQNVRAYKMVGGSHGAKSKTDSSDEGSRLSMASSEQSSNSSTNGVSVVTHMSMTMDSKSAVAQNNYLIESDESKSCIDNIKSPTIRKALKYVKLFDYSFAIGSVFLTGTNLGVALLMCSSIVANVSVQFNVGLIILAIIISWALSTFSLFMFMHVRRSVFRSAGAFIMSASIVAMEFIILSSMKFSFQRSPNRTLSSHVNQDTLQIIGSIVTAVISFIFIGLNVTRLKLSKDVLDMALFNMQKQNKKLTTNLENTKGLLTDSLSVISMIATLRPTVRLDSYSLVLARARQEQLENNENGEEGEMITPNPDPEHRNSEPSKSINKTKSGLRPTLKDILKNPITLEVFKDCVNTNHNMENIAFLIDVSNYKGANTAAKRLIGDQIINEFVKEGSPHQINISSSMRVEVLKKYEQNAGSSTAFKDAEKEVLRLIEVNDWLPFVKTDAYKLCEDLLAQGLATRVKSLQSKIYKKSEEDGDFKLFGLQLD